MRMPVTSWHVLAEHWDSILSGIFANVYRDCRIQSVSTGGKGKEEKAISIKYNFRT